MSRNEAESAWRAQVALHADALVPQREPAASGRRIADVQDCVAVLEDLQLAMAQTRALQRTLEQELLTLRVEIAVLRLRFAELPTDGPRRRIDRS